MVLNDFAEMAIQLLLRRFDSGLVNKDIRIQAEEGMRYPCVTGVQTCAIPISSRRRHTRSLCDWSSDVCSSDRKSTRLNSSHTVISYAVFCLRSEDGIRDHCVTGVRKSTRLNSSHTVISYAVFCLRSEERRVGKEGRSRWSAYH